MKYPEVFSSIYGLSACCLMNSPQPPPAGRAAPPKATPNPNGEQGHPVNVQYGEAAAWSPNPQKPPLFFDLPVENGVVRPAIAAKWIANSPLAMLDQYVPNMKKYKAIAMDIGLQDTLLNSNRDFDAALTRLGVAHTFETYEGDHSGKLGERMEQKVFPFFSRQLPFSGK
jgi:hypothetical protein